MPDLSERSIAQWLERLPEDVRSAIADGDVPPLAEGGLAAALETAAPFQVPDMVREHSADTHSFGRARRVRLMAWVARQTYPESGAIFRRLTGADDDGNEGGDAVGLLVLEDIRALAEALSPRLARRVSSASALDLVVQAAQTLESDMEFRQGGV